MKRIFLLTTVLFASVSLAIAQRTPDPNLRHLRTEVRSKAPNTGSPRHGAYAPSAHRTTKPGSVDAQLNGLEQETRKLGTEKSARETAPSPKTTAPETSNMSPRNHPTNFKYQPPKGGSTTTQSPHGSSATKSDIQRRVNGTGR